ncbi:MAG: ABC transporter ATP-binding protein [Kineosporiaceae bacterium]
MTLAAGSLVAVHGVSGSGKTTLLNLMAGLDVPSSGSVLVGGTDVGALTEDQRSRLRLTRVGVVFQEHHLIDEFTAVENVMLPLEVAGAKASEARVEALAALERMGLHGLAARYPCQLSGGQRQRVGICRALVGGRQVLLADEPTGALDSRNSLALLEILRGLSDQGAIVVVATHDPMVTSFADVVLTMSDGALTVGEPQARVPLRAPL